MPEASVAGPFTRSFTADEMESIRKGVIPEEMEDKWFIYFTENRLNFHRSWTGFCIYIAEFASEGGRHSIERVTINRDTEQYSEADIGYDLRLLNFLIDVLLLERNAEYPTKGDLSPDQTAIHQWSMIGRTSLR